MFNMEASRRRAQRRELKERFDREHRRNAVAWLHVWHGTAEIAPERLFWGVFRNLAKETSLRPEATCRGAGVDFEACWPIDPRCPGMRECARTHRARPRS